MFCDTGFLYAALVPHDAHHERAGELLDACLGNAARLYTTWDVVSETVTLLTYRYHSQAGVAFLHEVKPVLTIVPTSNAVLQEAEAIFRREAPRRRLSFCDAVSFVVVTTVLANVACLSFDRDFAALGLTVLR